MKVEKLEVGRMSMSRFKSVDGREEFLSQCLDIINKGKTLINEFNKSFDYSLDEEFILLQDADEFLTNSIGIIEDYTEGFSSNNMSFQRRLADFNLGYKISLALIDDNTSKFIPFTRENKQEIVVELKESIGHLACYVYNYFDFKSIVETEGNVDTIYDCMDYYMRRNNYGMDTMITIGNYLFDLMVEFNPSMGVFEKYPELVEPFSQLVGVDFYELDDLNLETVMNVVNGKTSIAEFEKMLEAKRTKNGDL